MGTDPNLNPKIDYDIGFQIGFVPEFSGFKIDFWVWVQIKIRTRFSFGAVENPKWIVI